MRAAPSRGRPPPVAAPMAALRGGGLLALVLVGLLVLLAPQTGAAFRGGATDRSARHSTLLLALPTRAGAGGAAESIAAAGLKLHLRPEPRGNMLHMEYFQRRWPGWLLRLPKWLIPIRPLAKAGIRTYSVGVSADEPGGTNGMLTAIEAIEGTMGDWSLGLLVYMYVHPSLRRQGLGDALLQQCLDECRMRGNSHVLLVHDDQGSGRLVQFYQSRGFRDVSSVVSKGMIKSLSAERLAN